MSRCRYQYHRYRPLVLSRKYLIRVKLSFSTCVAENPGALKIAGFYARNARRMTSHEPLGVTGTL